MVASPGLKSASHNEFGAFVSRIHHVGRALSRPAGQMPFFNGLLTVFRTTFTVRAADPPISKGNLDKWAHRIRMSIRKEGWTVSGSGDTVAIVRNDPVEFINWLNAPASAGDETQEQRRARDREMLFKHNYRITLRFVEKLSHDRHEELFLENASNWKQVERLRKGLNGIDHKFDQYIARSEEEVRRLNAYNDTVAKLPFHDLPDCYCDEYGIFYNSGFDYSASPYDDEVRKECEQVEDTLLRLFGTYPASLAAGQWYPQSDDNPHKSRGIVKVLRPKKS